MSCYISSNNERIYCALESSYGVIPVIVGADRIPALKLKAKQVPEQTGRKDKTGTRTFVGMPNGIREFATFEVDTLLTEWSNTSVGPAYGPLFQCAMGGTPVIWAGGTVSSVANAGTEIVFTSAHGLSPGQAVTFSGEMRFVTAILDTVTLFINAAFSTTPINGSSMGPTINYPLAECLPSASIFDYWDPSTAVQRIIEGAAMDKMQIKVNGDFQEFDFSGPARDLVDSASFISGQGGLTTFPAEPAAVNFDYTIVPGHLGELWMGVTPAEFLTMTSAELTLENNVDLRVREFGSDYYPNNGFLPTDPSYVAFSGMPFYDAWTQAQFLAEYGRAMTVFTTNTVDPTAYPDEVAFLQAILGNFTASIMTYVRTTQPSCRFEVLYPTDVNSMAFNSAFNFPPSAWTPAALTILKTECIGYTLVRDLDLIETSIDFGASLGFPASQRSHLVDVSDSTTPWLKEVHMAEGKGLESVVLFALDQYCLIGYPTPLPPNMRRSIRMGN